MKCIMSQVRCILGTLNDLVMDVKVSFSLRIYAFIYIYQMKLKMVSITMDTDNTKLENKFDDQFIIIALIAICLKSNTKHNIAHTLFDNIFVWFNHKTCLRDFLRVFGNDMHFFLLSGTNWRCRSYYCIFTV